MIKKTLYQSLREEGVLRRRAPLDEERRRIVEEAEENEKIKQKKVEEYKALNLRLLTSLANRDGLKAMKIGLGEISASGDDLFDGIYLRKDGKRIGVITFADHHQVQSVHKMTNSALYELQKGNFAYVYIILFGKIESFEREFADVISITNSELKKSISITVCPPDKIEETAKSLAIPEN